MIVGDDVGDGVIVGADEGALLGGVSDPSHSKQKGPGGETRKEGGSLLGHPDPENMDVTFVEGENLRDQTHKF